MASIKLPMSSGEPRQLNNEIKVDVRKNVSLNTQGEIPVIDIIQISPLQHLVIYPNNQYLLFEAEMKSNVFKSNVQLTESAESDDLVNINIHLA